MNILMIRGDLKQAGPGISIYRLSHLLRDRGLNVIIVSSGGDLLNKLKQDGFTTYEVEGLAIGGRSLPALGRAVTQLRRILADEKIDVVHGHNMVSTFLTRMASIGLAMQQPRYLTSIHGKGKEWLFRYAPGTLIGVSQDQLSYIRSHAPYTPTYCLYATNPWLVDAPRSLRPGRPLRLISVAHFTGMKGHHRLIQICKVLRDREIDFSLKMVGEGPARADIASLVKTEGLDEHIELLGLRNDVREVLESSDIFVHLPDYETFGIACQEALCAGLPAVVARVGGLPEIAASPDFSSLIDLSEEDMAIRAADAILSFNNPEIYAKASLCALKHIAQFAPGVIVEDLVRVYKNGAPELTGA